MKIDPNRTYKQWAESYTDPPGIYPGLIEEMEQHIEYPGYRLHGHQVLPAVETWDVNGNVMGHRVGLVVFLMEKDEP